tara:strand:- start:1751 stop:2785 length:1035 start_codon:yes stop_codon:yes gene_type:complete
LYLDQFFFSGTFKENDSRFQSVAEKIQDLAAKQLIVTPFSSVHEDETHIWRGYAGRSKDELMEFIKRSARGHEFEPTYSVENAQIVQAFSSFLDKRQPTLHIEEKDVLRENVHCWDDYMWIDVGRYIQDIDEMRDRKDETTNTLVDQLEAWRNSSNTFEQNVDREFRDAAQIYLDTFLTYMQRLAAGDFMATLDSPISSEIVQSLLHYLSDDVASEEKIKTIVQFFKSDHFRNVASLRVFGEMFAVFIEQVKGGAFANKEKARPRLAGFMNDLRHISTYGPYVDAFVMDQYMANLVRDGRVSLRAEFGTKIYSLNNLDDLLSWLDGLENQMNDEHTKALAIAYG